MRELENLIRRLAVLHSGETIPAAAIAAELTRTGRFAEAAGDDDSTASLAAAVEQHLTRYFAAHGDALPPPGLYDRVVQEVERPLLSICLGATRGNQIRAAHLLGLNRNTLRKKIRDLGLEVIRGLKVGLTAGADPANPVAIAERSILATGCGIATLPAQSSPMR